MKKMFFINLIILFILSIAEGFVGVGAADVEMEKYAVFIKDNLKKCGYSDEEINQVIQDSRLQFHIEFFKKADEEEKKKDKDEKEKEETTQEKINKFVKKIMAKESVTEGKNFLAENQDLLASIESIYGVPREIIAAILAVETFFDKAEFNKAKGDYYVFNALASRAYGRHRGIYKNKTDWKNEMRIFAEICKNNNLEIFDYTGSRAGCFGIVQFLPSSYVNFAIDGNQDGKVDLFNMEDAVHSAANYLKENGWRGNKFSSNRKALYRYNRATWYVNLLINYAEAVKKEIDAVKAEEE